MDTITFAAADWAAGAADRITIVAPTVVPGAGEIGPHEFPPGGAQLVQVYRDAVAPDINQVTVTVTINLTTGSITLIKAAAVANFDGRVVIGGSS